MWNQQQQPQINVEIKKEGAVAVAIDKDKGSQYALKWAIDNVLNKGQTVTLLHVRQKQSTNSSLSSTSIPLSDVNEDVAKSVRTYAETQAHEIFLPFRCFCNRKDIKCNEVIIEDNNISKALTDYCHINVIDIMVVSASTRNKLLRRFKGSDIATNLTKGCPEFCSVYVISKGKMLSVRSTIRPIRRQASQNPAQSNLCSTNDSPRYCNSGVRGGAASREKERSPFDPNRLSEDMDMNTISDAKNREGEFRSFSARWRSRRVTVGTVRRRKSGEATAATGWRVASPVIAATMCSSTDENQREQRRREKMRQHHQQPTTTTAAATQVAAATTSGDMFVGGAPRGGVSKLQCTVAKPASNSRDGEAAKVRRSYSGDRVARRKSGDCSNHVQQHRRKPARTEEERENETTSPATNNNNCGSNTSSSGDDVRRHVRRWSTDGTTGSSRGITSEKAAISPLGAFIMASFKDWVPKDDGGGGSGASSGMMLKLSFA
ncbi:hypothetical protein BVRB_2g035940 [Beta vulgaris subsp. vulgaris]|nr:hypothetical protein BVRB_2g035940 [Beta vulgaris subsp. vulgaris]